MGKIKKVQILLILVLMLFVVAGCGNNQMPPEPKGSLLPYNIIRYDDISTAAATRYTLRIEIPGQPTVEDIKNISKKVAYDFAKEDGNKFNSLTMYFYDYKEYHGLSAPTLGEAIYAPQGDIAKANTVQAGEYNKMSFNYKIKEKDWNKKLSREEVEVWSAFMKEMKAVGEEEAEKIISKEYNITQEEVESIFNKQIAWVI